MTSSIKFLVPFLTLCLFTCEFSFATALDDQGFQLPLKAPYELPLSTTHDFTLRHIYHKGSHQYPHLFRKVDVNRDTLLDFENEDGTSTLRPAWDSFSVQSNMLMIQRLADRRRHVVDSLLEHGAASNGPRALYAGAWTLDEVSGPDVTNKKTVLSFAHMAANAYVSVPRKGDWIDIGDGFNYTEDFGWENDGLRGHIFADTENKTVVIGLKGTSVWFFDPPETTNNDRLNDNLFGSCCCGQGGQYAWKRVCECQTSAYTCNSTCLVSSLRKKSSYYHAARALYHNVTALYPKADIWLTGHSLGGVVSSLLGATYGVPTLTFETFPDALAAHRLGLPTPPGHQIGESAKRHYTGTFHFGHTADPIYVGNCNSFDSPCTLAGYAFQSKCHTGYNCTYDTVGDLGWGISIGTHRISSVIKDVIEPYDSVPTCMQDIGCKDCSEWSFFEGNGTKATTSSTKTASSMQSTTTATTTTCRTPGWWGCLDKSTTTRTTSTSTTVSSSTCSTPGWWGCKDASTTTNSSRSHSTVMDSTATPLP